MSREQTMVMVSVPCNLLDRAMHAFDVFEDFKRLATVKYLHMTLAPDANLRRILQHALDTAKQVDMRIIAVFYPHTDIGWVDETCKVISNGECFQPLDDVLQEHGFQRPAPKPEMVGEGI
jgi:hypothetical protein